MSDPNDILSADPATTSNDTTTYLDQLVGEGKQFKDAEAVAKAKADSDRFIAQLKRENAEMLGRMKELEKKADAKVAITDVLNELKNRTASETTNNQGGINEDEIAQKVREAMDGYSSAKADAANLASANTALLKKFNGDAAAAKKFVASRTAALNLDAVVVRNLAKSSPQAFSELLGLTTAKAPDANTFIPNSQGGGTPPSDSSTRNGKYYNGLLKEMGSSKFYQNKDLLNQLEQDIARLGDAYHA